MDFTVLTIFPEMVNSFFSHGIVRRAIESGRVTAGSIDIRDYAAGRHRQVDDRPYGGGNGMVMKPEPLAAAIGAAQQEKPAARTVLLSPQGRLFSQAVAAELAERETDLIFICGRYEGIDERIREQWVTDEISVGDYVLTGGELAAMIIIDAVTRLIPGVLGGEESAARETFQDGLLEHAHYTRPAVFAGEEVPEVLISGDHERIDTWRMESSLRRTFINRPDLLRQKRIGNRERRILEKWCRDIEAIIAG
ncbi:MAG: tRNA (guanosine(37)-N1)-methyltransferase TrmD [Desulfosudaceae bacterium]